MALCYHYVRNQNNQFPRILGTRIEDFEKNIAVIKNKFNMISQDDILESYYAEKNEIGYEKGMLFTFDDGLSDHFEAAKILFKNNIKAIFFIPTCIITEQLPANPTIIHYTIAEFGITMFLKFFHRALKYYKVNDDRYFINFNKGIDDPWETIRKIKNIFKYFLENSVSRSILLYIYKNLFLKKYPDALKIMHLGESEIKEILKMGHHIGVHTHSHISVGPSKLSSKEKKIELVRPKQILEKKFNVKINSFSYPFGERLDCLNSKSLPKELKQYKIIFTVEENFNTFKTSPLELGRYQPHSKDTTKSLIKNLEKIMSKKI